MISIDKQRISAVRTLESLGYRFRDEWQAPADAVASFMVEGDQMHLSLVQRADQLEGCSEGSPEEAELAAISEAIEAYEAKRWPDGKAPGGKA